MSSSVFESPVKAGKVLEFVNAGIAVVEAKAAALAGDKEQATAAVRQAAEDFVAYFDVGYPKDYKAPVIVNFKATRLDGMKRLVQALKLMDPTADVTIDGELIDTVNNLERDAFVKTSPRINL